MRLKTLALAAAAMTLSAQAVAAPSPKPCVTPTELRSAVLFISPQLIEAVVKQCAPNLPAGAYLTTNGHVLADRYRAAASGAWADVTPLIARIPDLAPFRMLDEKAAQDLMGGMIVSGVAKDKVAVKDCAAIDRVLAALDPLPPANMAELIGALVELGGRKPGKADFLCPAAPPRP